MIRYNCHFCGDQYSTDNMAPFCGECHFKARYEARAIAFETAAEIVRRTYPRIIVGSLADYFDKKAKIARGKT